MIFLYDYLDLFIIVSALILVVLIVFTIYSYMGASSFNKTEKDTIDKSALTEKYITNTIISNFQNHVDEEQLKKVNKKNITLRRTKKS